LARGLHGAGWPRPARPLGWNRARSTCSQQRRRRRLAALLLQRDPPADAAAIESAAADAGWRLPQTLAAVAARVEVDRLARRLDPDALVLQAGELACALLPDPGAPGRDLGAALRETPAALGPAVPWREVALSFERARAVLVLAEARVIEDGAEPLLADDHSTDLLLHTDRALARDVAAAALRPLEPLGDGARTRLRETLEAWLRHRGRTETVAEALHVHPQTVRYRMAKLRELFGDALEDPDRRFELELALRVAPAEA